MSWRDHIPEDITELYEIHDWRHAAAILSKEFPEEFEDICYALRNFTITKADILKPGGNQSPIPPKFGDLLKECDWDYEENLTAKLVVDDKTVSHDSHKVDYIKGRVAFDIEWNSKDQTFDRDLYAFRAFFEYDKISVGVLITRSNSLNPVFESLGNYTDRYGTERAIKAKYGASTTHMGKLLPRLMAGRSGGCPVLVFGITPQIIEDYE